MDTCGQEGGVAGPGGHTSGICTFQPGHDGRHSWEPDDDVVVGDPLVEKLRDSPIPNLEKRATFEPPAAAAWDAGYEAGLLAQSQKSQGRPKFKIFNPYRKR